MWSRMITTKKEKVMKIKEARKSMNLNEEYLCAVRTKSFADFFIKVQILEKDNSSSPSQVLLDPGQETIASLLEASDHNLKPLLFDYFDISAEAWNFCSKLLGSLNQLQDDHRCIHRAINGSDSSTSTISELRSRIIADGAFAVPNRQDFRCIHEKHSSVLQQLKSHRKSVGRKIKMIKFFNKASGICIATACGAVAAAAVFLAMHTVAGMIMGPLIFTTLPTKKLKKIFQKSGFVKYGLLRRVLEQVDVAAKGAYILKRDFDTMGRLVARLQDEIKHKRAMIELCLQRTEDRFCSQVLKELNKYQVGFIKQVEELEEHVYLCLVTINRARALLVKEIN